MKIPDQVKLKVFNGILTHLRKAAKFDPRPRERMRATVGLRTIKFWIQKETDALKKRG